jgi:hypothetical protein
VTRDRWYTLGGVTRPGLAVPQAFEVSWTELKHFTPGRQRLPAGTTVVEAGWPAGQPAQAGWPDAPVGWRIVASDQDVGWVVAFGLAGAYAWNISHHGFPMHPPPAFIT